MKGEGADVITKGDEITVTGVLKNYYGTIEFDAGCTLDSYVAHECAWVDATCLRAQYCSICGAEEGELAEHNYVDGACTVCGMAEGVSLTTVNVSIADYADANGWVDATQYQTLTMDENITVTAKRTTGTPTLVSITPAVMSGERMKTKSPKLR
jgi:hypothetical protein